MDDVFSFAIGLSPILDGSIRVAKPYWRTQWRELDLRFETDVTKKYDKMPDTREIKDVLFNLSNMFRWLNFTRLL